MTGGGRIALVAGGVAVLAMAFAMGWLKAHEGERVFERFRSHAG